MTSCAGTPRIEYVRLAADVPAFPVFPAPDCVALDDNTETVSMPLWYWIKIAEYKIGVDAVETYLKKTNEKIKERNRVD